MSREGEESSKKRKFSEKSHNFKKSASKEAYAVFNQYFKHYDVALERGIDMRIASDTIKDIVTHYHWKKLVKIRETNVNHTIVAEFYAILSQIPSLEEVQTIELRKAKVTFTPETINAFLGIPEVPHDQIYSVVWELDDSKNQFSKSREAQGFINPCATWRDGRFRIGGASNDAKVIKHLTAFNILPHFKTSDLNWSEACMVYAILTKQPIDVGMIIHKEAFRFAKAFAERGAMPYPGLITDLCMKAKVPSFPSDKLLPPSSLKITSKAPQSGISEPQATSSVPLGGSSSSQQFSNLSQGSYFQDPALVARLDNMEANMREMRGSMQTLNDNVLRGMEMNRQLNENMFRGFDMARQWSEDLRVAARGQRDLSWGIYNQHSINLEDFDTCQAEPYTMPIWNPLSPPTPTHTLGQTFGGGTDSFAGTTSGSIPVTGLTTGFGGMSLQSSTVVSTQFGAPYTGSLQTLASIAAQASSPTYFDPSLFPVSSASLLPQVPFVPTTLPPGGSYHIPSPDDVFEGFD